MTIPGLSKWVENITLYYQLGGFQASINDDIRSSFLGEVFGISSTRMEQVFKGTATVDAQLSYAFTDGMLKGLDPDRHRLEPDQSGNADLSERRSPREVLTWEEYDRLYTIGFSYSYQ